MTYADVAVVGAGPAGAMAACVLARAGLRVALLDEVNEAPRIGESLPGAVRPLLRDSGLLAALEAGITRPAAGNLSAWGSAELVAADSIRDPHGPGLHVDRARFDAALRAGAVCAGASRIRARVRAFEFQPAGWTVQHTAGSLQARFLVDASGRRALAAQQLGIGRVQDEALVALYAWGSAGAPDQRTVIEAVPQGWWYTAALPGGKRVAAMHVLPPVAARILRSQGWQQELARTLHIQRYCQPGTAWSAPRGTDAAGARMERCTGEGWLAVGDAALAFDPLSSQGIFNALYTGLRGGQAVVGALDGDRQALPRYEERLREVRHRYRQHVRLYYGAEHRWPTEDFWRSRLPGTHRLR